MSVVIAKIAIGVVEVAATVAAGIVFDKYVAVPAVKKVLAPIKTKAGI